MLIQAIIQALFRNILMKNGRKKKGSKITSQKKFCYFKITKLEGITKIV